MVMLITAHRGRRPPLRTELPARRAALPLRVSPLSSHPLLFTQLRSHSAPHEPACSAPMSFPGKARASMGDEE